MVKGVGLGPLQALAAVPGPFQIREAGTASIFPAIDEQPLREVRQSDQLQWGVDKINSTGCWNSGYEGENIVVGVIDTGLFAEHEALVDAYRNDDASWLDAFNQHDTP